MATAAENVETARNAIAAILAEISCTDDVDRINGLLDALKKAQEQLNQLEGPMEVVSQGIT